MARETDPIGRPASKCVRHRCKRVLKPTTRTCPVCLFPTQPITIYNGDPDKMEAQAVEERRMNNPGGSNA